MKNTTIANKIENIYCAEVAKNYYIKKSRETKRKNGNGYFFTLELKENDASDGTWEAKKEMHMKEGESGRGASL